jgi:UDP-4-amino-4,6-dideoxy-N-acetyl-beta-L-altrosamine transaminase
VIPYSTQSISDADIEAVKAVLTSGWLTQGPAIPRFEQAFAAAHATSNAIAVSNATSGLHIACLALGLGPGDRLWTSTNSFVASSNCALYCGATVDFVDIDPATRNLSISALEQKLAAAQRAGTLPKIVVPVDFAGLPGELRPLRELADRYGFRILEDASHAVGAQYEGVPLGGSFADITVFSFHPVKIITTAEGGMLTTNDSALAERLRLLRTHGITRDASRFSGEAHGPWYYEQIDLGYNFRMTDIQAALGTSQLGRIGQLHARRLALAQRYDRLLASLPLLRLAVPANRSCAWHLYVIEIDESCGVARGTVFQRLRDRGIAANVHYIPIHLQPYYRRLGFEPGMFPAAERYYSRALSIPLYPALTDAQQDEVVAALTDALEA